MSMFEAPADRAYLVDLEDGVLRVSFNRPEAGNAVPMMTVPSLSSLFRDAKASDQVRCILVRGEGKNFSAGGDIASFAKSLEKDRDARLEEWRLRMSNLRRLTEAFVGFDRPVVVALRGGVAGAGLLYPLASDYVIGDPTALFLFAHQNMGLNPDNGVTALLSQSVGQRRARKLLLTAARVKADEALALGLLDQIVSDAELDAAALAQAKRFARAPQRAVRLAKTLVNEAAGRPLGEHLVAEGAAIVSCVDDPDFAEGVRAFMDKRRPDFPSTR